MVPKTTNTHRLLTAAALTLSALFLLGANPFSRVAESVSLKCVDCGALDTLDDVEIPWCDASVDGQCEKVPGEGAPLGGAPQDLPGFVSEMSIPSSKPTVAVTGYARASCANVRDGFLRGIKRPPRV